MIRVAVYADIHANLAALRAVLADLEREGVDDAICAGDLVGQGPQPNEVVELVRAAGHAAIPGNQEAEVLAKVGRAKNDPKRHVHWTASNLTKANRRWLASLPAEVRRQVGGADLLVVHGSPRGVYDYLFPSLSETSLAALFPGGDRPDVLVGGNSHIPFVAEVGGMLVVNAGSVGKPIDRDPRAMWALLTLGDGPPRAEIRRVAWPVEETLDAMRRVGMQKWRIRAQAEAIRRWPADHRER